MLTGSNFTPRETCCTPSIATQCVPQPAVHASLTSHPGPRWQVSPSYRRYRIVTVILERADSAPRGAPEPMLDDDKSPTQVLLVKLFAVVPLLALVAAVPFAWGWGLGWVDI